VFGGRPAGCGEWTVGRGVGRCWLVSVRALWCSRCRRAGNTVGQPHVDQGQVDHRTRMTAPLATTLAAAQALGRGDEAICLRPGERTGLEVWWLTGSATTVEGPDRVARLRAPAAAVVESFDGLGGSESGPRSSRHQESLTAPMSHTSMAPVPPRRPATGPTPRPPSRGQPRCDDCIDRFTGTARVRHRR